MVFCKINTAASCAALLTAFVAVSGCNSSSSSSTAALEVVPHRSAENGVKISVTRTGEIHLFRGLANVFSDGINVIGARMQRNGMDARVYNHSRWQSVTEDIIVRSKRIGGVSYPIVIMGHSLGGNASVQMAKYLGDRGIKVAKVVAFDPTITTYVGPNIGNVRNYYIPKRDNENVVREATGYTGQLENIDMTVRDGVDHFNIEKQVDIQIKLVKETRALTRNKRVEAPENTNR
ncbi:MAG: hypothetical protein JKX91_03955 [Rhizobiaceae bacterium]|nr:hypothetical protein [Rhizobiaceae bacterium]